MVIDTFACSAVSATATIQAVQAIGSAETHLPSLVSASFPAHRFAFVPLILSRHLSLSCK